MLQRVIVHPGFHKTGTSSVQRALRAGRTDLAPLWQIGLEEDFPDAAAAARAYSLRRDPLDLGLFQQALADWIETLDLAGAEGLLLSCESLMGEIPGPPDGARDYSAGPDLAAALVEVLHAGFGPDVAVTLHLSTRDGAGWLESLHWQLVRGGLVDERFGAFARRMRGHADLAAQARAIAAAVAPVPVQIAPLAEMTGPEGPLGPLLDLMGWPAARRQAFQALPRVNARPPHVDRLHLANRFARINRRVEGREAAKAVKQRMMARIWARARRTRAQNEEQT